MQTNDATDNGLKVIEMFAGVGGFRLGLEAVHGRPFSVILSNQFEPSRKKQHASEIYQARWPDTRHINEDIFEVLKSSEGRQAILDAQADVVVGGFPCQDYSVARPLSASGGLAGKKGVLWWAIAGLLTQCIGNAHPVKYLILENVDRLLSSPATCRGRDFAVILATLHELGYAAEWRVINAAEYGHAQRRRRIFIVAYHRSTRLYRQMRTSLSAAECGWPSNAVLSAAFPAAFPNPLAAVSSALSVGSDPLTTQLWYRPLSNGRTRFENCGLMLDGEVRTCRATAIALTDFSEFTGHATPLTLGDVVRATGPVSTSFYIAPELQASWRAAKGSKAIPRSKNGFEYTYSEGAMAFPDPLDRPSRTIITSEGGTTSSRTKHAIQEPSGLIRRLTPEELEALNGFPRGFTAITGVSDTTRAMLMGNALVVGLVKRIGEALYRAHIDTRTKALGEAEDTSSSRSGVSFACSGRS
jgi:DNA (cytosine-5)-methyltransferase 1